MEAFAQRQRDRDRAMDEEEAQDRKLNFGMQHREQRGIDSPEPGGLAEVSMDTGVIGDDDEDVELRQIVQLYNVEEREATTEGDIVHCGVIGWKPPGLQAREISQSECDHQRVLLTAEDQCTGA